MGFNNSNLSHKALKDVALDIDVTVYLEGKSLEVNPDPDPDHEFPRQ